MLSTRFNRWTIAAVTVAALAVPGQLAAQTPEHTGDSAAQFPSRTDLKALTTSGSYLAARHASVERYGAGDAKAAVAGIDKLTGPEWYPIFKDLHAGMILELAGKEKDAGARFERAYKLDDSMLRITEAYARWTSRNKDTAAASAIFET